MAASASVITPQINSSADIASKALQDIDTKLSPKDVRDIIKQGRFGLPSTAGLCPGYLQTNLIILPRKIADDFRLLCIRNPVSCPLIAETKPGDPAFDEAVAQSSDIRTQCPAYNIYRDGKLIETKSNVLDEWNEDSVAFLIGCSYTFEHDLIEYGYIPRHIELNRNCAMYKTKIPLCPSGVFSGHLVVSMRPYPVKDLEKVREITRPFVRSHGEPVAWGAEGARQLGIKDDPTGTNPDFGDPSEIRDGEIPVFWACGVTPQLVVMDSKIDGVTIGHNPGQMFITDQTISDACKRPQL